MESLSQDKNGRRALLNKQIHEVSLLSPLVVHKRHGFIHIMVVNMIFLPQIYDILDFCFLSQWVQVFGLYYCVGLTFSTIQVLDFLFSDPEGQVQWLKTNEA